MKKSELLARITALENRLAALEARPYYYVPPYIPSLFHPAVPQPSWTITSTGGEGISPMTVPAFCIGALGQ